MPDLKMFMSICVFIEVAEKLGDPMSSTKRVATIPRDDMDNFLIGDRSLSPMQPAFLTAEC